jgi:hypothetical protein
VSALSTTRTDAPGGRGGPLGDLAVRFGNAIGGLGVGLLIVLAIEIIFFSARSPYFFDADNFNNIGRAMTIVGIAARFYAEAQIAFTVPPSVFIPPPRVESAVVLLETRTELPLPQNERARFFKIVNAGFRHKRKQLANSIADELAAPKAAVTDWLTILK